MKSDEQSKPPDPQEDLQFRKEVVIDDLPFIFEGVKPNIPSNFLWIVRVPNWEEQEPKVEEFIRKAGINPYWVEDLKSSSLGEGAVGSLDISKVEPKDGAPSIGISRVQTATLYLPLEFGYHNAKGIGSFLLDSLCELADKRGWRIYLEPLERGGGLEQHQLYAWYRRHGFKNDHQFPKESRHGFGGMIRQPGESTSSLPRKKFIRNRRPV